MRPSDQRLIKYLRELASNGEACPTNAAIGEALCHSKGTIEHSFMRLRDDGYLTCEYVGNRRIVTFLDDGVGTADPTPPETITVLPAISGIIESVSDIFGIGTRNITAPGKVTHIVRARQAVCLVAADRGHGPMAIGRAVNRTHKTVSHNIEVAREYEARDEIFAAKVRAVRERTPLPFSKIVRAERAA